ncbi:E3 ubiquitin-protein ligase, RNF216-like [Skeletonema marinoi]|uniref:E3 ubiquitin-protein ligase, RNF216-like n=1 Tax=Skeletonema marinoi TaxID=267567 RepID=A0AAD9D5P3_9STRA|nr:E3 ubiquitin-protein ligase, RNF216-like [Skeletonema marinoi]
MAATDNIYDVEAVIGYRNNTDRGRDEFLIKWVDFGEEESSWEPATNLSDVSVELARTYQEKVDNLPHPSNAYLRQARQLLLNTFQRVSCAAIDIFFRLCKYNFTRSFHYISLINHQRTNNGNGAGQFDLIPKQVKVFVKKNRQKTQLEVTDETLLGELDDIPALNQKDGGTNTKQGVATPKKLLEPAIDLTGDSSDDEEKKEEEKECGCCFGDYPVSALKQCSAGENHNVCRDCIQRYVSEQLDGNGSTVFKCIVSAECSCEYSLAFLDQVLSPTLKKRANEMVALEEIKKAGGDDGTLWQCPKCAHMGFIDGKPTWIHCPECNVMYCTSCNANHTGLTCDEFQRQQTLGKDSKHLAAEAMSRACTRSCPHCGQDYMKSDGCNKIRCKCGKLSCYLCGEKIADYSHFCDKMRCDCGKCQLWTSTEEMERIDGEKRQQAGRKVLLEQGITNEEEITAILSSLDEEEDEDDQSVDTAAAVQGGGAGYQRAAAAAARQHRPVDVPWFQRIQAQIDRMNAAIRDQNRMNAALLDQMDLLGPDPRPQQGIEFGAAAPQRADPPAVGENPAFRAQIDLLDPNPPPQQDLAFGAAAPAPRRAAPQVAGDPPQGFVFGAAPNRRAEVPNPPAAAALPNPQQAFGLPAFVPPPQQGFVFGAAAPQRERAAPQVAGNQRAAAAAARQNLPVDAPWHQRLQAHPQAAPAPQPQRDNPPAGENPAFRAQNNFLGPNPPPQQGLCLGQLLQHLRETLRLHHREPHLQLLEIVHKGLSLEQPLTVGLKCPILLLPLLGKTLSSHSVFNNLTLMERKFRRRKFSTTSSSSRMSIGSLKTLV